MESLPYQMENGLLFVRLGEERALVCTGVADSMSSRGQLTLEGRSFATKSQTLRMTPTSLSAEIGSRVDALLGADILSRFDYRFNPFRQELSVSTDEIHPYGYAAHLNLFRSIPIISVWVNSKETPMFFNTGSRLTFLAPEIAARFPQVGAARVFYPGIGWFQTPVHRVLIWMSGNDVELEVGIPPAALLETLRSAHSSGLLGCDVFQGPGVFLASRRREVIWFWHDY
jgi:hypothetical protein